MTDILYIVCARWSIFQGRGKGLNPIILDQLRAVQKSLNKRVPPSEIIAEEMRRSTRGHFNVIHHSTGFKADFYPWQRNAEWSWVWEQLRRDDIDGHTVCFAPPEYVILSKLEFYREGGSEKHLRDIRGMLAISGDQIDRRLIEAAVAKLGLTEQWRKTTTD